MRIFKMKFFIAAVVAAFLLCSLGVAGGFFSEGLAQAALIFLAIKAGLLTVTALITIMLARPGSALPILFGLALVVEALPVPTCSAAGFAGIAVSVIGALLAVRKKRHGMFALLLVSGLLGIGRIGVDLGFPEYTLVWGGIILAALGLAGAAYGIYLLAIASRFAIWSSAALYFGALILVVVPALSPATQFNALMALLIVAFIVGAALIAALFTFLFLRAFEKLDSNLVHAYFFFIPVTAAPFYLFARELHSMEAGLAADTWRWSSYSFSMDIVLAGSLLVLWLARTIGRRIGPRNFVPLVAWKFLRSQRAVHTPATRRRLMLRKLSPGPGGSGGLLRFLVETAIVCALAAGLYEITNRVIPAQANVLLGKTGIVCLCAAWFGSRALAAGSDSQRLFVLPALAAGLYSLYMVQSSAALNPSQFSRIGPLAVACIPVAILAAQFVTRLVLNFLGSGGRLPGGLDPRLAPQIETRIRQGVGASVFVSVVGVAIGVWALIVVLSVMSGFSGELERRIVSTKDHVMMKASKGSREITDPLKLAEMVRGLKGVRTANPYVEGEAMMSSSVNISSTVTIRGVDKWGDALAFLEPSLVAGTLDFFRHPENLVSFPGVYPFFQQPDAASIDLWDEELPDDEPEEDEIEEVAPGLITMPEIPDDEDYEGLFPMPPIDGDGEMPSSMGTSRPDPVFAASDENVLPPLVIGQELAKSLGVGIGSKITVISPDGDVGPMGVQPKARSFLVAAIFETGMYEYDLKLAYMYMVDAQRFFNLGDSVDHIDVRLLDLKASMQVRERIEATGAAGGLEVLTWQEMNRNLFSALKLERVVMFIVLGFIILIASFNIVTSLIIIIRRRLSAIAILKTMGAAANDVTGIFFLLGSAAGLFGIASGVIMGLSSCGIIKHLGITLPREYYIRSLPVLVDGWQIAQVTAAAFLITALASLYPGRLASKVLLVEGLKDER